MKVKKLSVMALAALLALSVCGCEQAPEREVLRVEYEDDLQRNELLKRITHSPATIRRWPPAAGFPIKKPSRRQNRGQRYFDSIYKTAARTGGCFRANIFR